jgi:hypothetical protein
MTMTRDAISTRENTAPATCPEYMYPAWGETMPKAFSFFFGLSRNFSISRRKLTGLAV